MHSILPSNSKHQHPISVSYYYYFPLCRPIKKQVKMEQTRTRPEKKAIKGASTTTCLTSPAQDRFQWLTSPTEILQMDITVLCI